MFLAQLWVFLCGSFGIVLRYIRAGWARTWEVETWVSAVLLAWGREGSQLRGHDFPGSNPAGGCRRLLPDSNRSNPAPGHRRRPCVNVQQASLDLQVLGDAPMTYTSLHPRAPSALE